MRSLFALAALLSATVAAAQTMDDGFAALRHLEFEKASGIFAEHARRGNDTAQIELGFMYAIGEGIPEDKVQAYKWLSVAAASGNDVAGVLLDTLERRMTPDQIEEAKRLASQFRPQ
jgi:TPR repeat protein